MIGGHLILGDSAIGRACSGICAAWGNPEIRAHLVLGLATLLGAVAMWLMLPRGGARGRRLGAVLGLVSLVLLAGQVPLLGDWAGDAVFYLLAAVTVISAAATVTFRSPVYCAIWFALSLLGTAGLFLFQGAQFLGVATIVVYAGAILVTFLFVLMLAQPEGDAFYDRISWEGMLSACTGALLVGVLTLKVTSAFHPGAAQPPVEDLAAENLDEQAQPPVAAAAPLAARFTAEQLDEQVLSSEHMAHLGGELFSRYLIAVEVAGTLLLVALVGAVAIVIQSAKSDVGRAGGGPPASAAAERLDPRSVAPCGGPEDEALRESGHQPREEVLHG